MTYENITQLEEGLWIVRFAYKDPLTGNIKRVKRRVHGTLAQAIVERERLLALAQDGTEALESDKVGHRKVSDLAPSFFEHLLTRRKPIKEAQRRNSQIIWDSRVKPCIGDWVIGEIKRSSISKLLTSWAGEKKGDGEYYSMGTVRQWRAFTTSLLTFCFERAGREDLHILKDHRLPEEEPREKPGRALTRDEAMEILEYLWDDNPFWYSFVFVSLATGQRFASVSALRWVDIRKDEIVFETSQHSGVVRRGNKSGKVISIPLSDELREVLEAHRDYLGVLDSPFKDLGLVFPALTKRGTGGYLDVSTVRYALRKACIAKGIDPITPHDLRRTANTWLVEAGVNGSLIRAMIGHSDVSLTDRYYRPSGDVKEMAAMSLIPHKVSKR